MPRVMPSARRGRESGQLTLLIIGFALILTLAVAVVVNASNVFLQRRSLASWADGAVVVAAQNLAYEELYGGVPLATLPIAESAAQDAVADYVAENDLAGRFRELRVTSVAVDPATGRVTVALAASVPLVLMDGLGAVPVTADSSAVAPFR
jgi:uncharacterized membrane protein